MKKLLLTLILLTGIFSAPVFAEKIPVKLENTKLISTHHDEIQLGDYIPFRIANDVYINKKLYIKKDTKVIGLVDFVQDNGWAGYGAEVRFKNFTTKDANEKVVTIISPITLDGNAETYASTVNYMADKGIFITYFLGKFSDIFMFVRGHEIKIEPEHASFNIFIEQ